MSPSIIAWEAGCNLHPCISRTWSGARSRVQWPIKQYSRGWSLEHLQRGNRYASASSRSSHSSVLLGRQLWAAWSIWNTESCLGLVYFVYFESHENSGQDNFFSTPVVWPLTAKGKALFRMKFLPTWELIHPSDLSSQFTQKFVSLGSEVKMAAWGKGAHFSAFRASVNRTPSWASSHHGPLLPSCWEHLSHSGWEKSIM